MTLLPADITTDLNNIRKSIVREPVPDDINLLIHDKELLTFLVPSAVEKSPRLRILTDIDAPP